MFQDLAKSAGQGISNLMRGSASGPTSYDNTPAQDKMARKIFTNNFIRRAKESLADAVKHGLVNPANQDVNISGDKKTANVDLHLAPEPDVPSSRNAPEKKPDDGQLELQLEPNTNSTSGRNAPNTTEDIGDLKRLSGIQEGFPPRKPAATRAYQRPEQLAKSTQAKPVQPQSGTQPADAPPTKPENDDLAAIKKNAGISYAQPEQPKPEQPKPEQPKPEQPKPEQPKPENDDLAAIKKNAGISDTQDAIQAARDKQKIAQQKAQDEVDASEQPKPEQPKPEQPKPEQPKPEQPQNQQTSDNSLPSIGQWLNDNFINGFLRGVPYVEKAGPQVTKILQNISKNYPKIDQDLQSLADIGWTLSPYKGKGQRDRY
jgi:hypothetical protein